MAISAQVMVNCLLSVCPVVLSCSSSIIRTFYFGNLRLFLLAGTVNVHVPSPTLCIGPSPLHL